MTIDFTSLPTDANTGLFVVVEVLEDSDDFTTGLPEGWEEYSEEYLSTAPRTSWMEPSTYTVRRVVGPARAVMAAFAKKAGVILVQAEG